MLSVLALNTNGVIVGREPCQETGGFFSIMHCDRDRIPISVGRIIGAGQSGIDRDYTVGSCARPAYAVPDVCAGRGIAPDRAGAAGPSQLIGDLGGVACTARHLSRTVYVA